MHGLFCPHCWVALVLFLIAFVPILKVYAPSWRKKLKTKTHTEHTHCTHNQDEVDYVRSDSESGV